ncbi:MAG: hypothetical protein MJZ04_07255 [Bacteroidales bacterium]|nr:hypothetical protein [Bacteroidales bacterium]
MAAEYKSRHGMVARPPYELYMSFVDMRNFVSMLPEDRKNDVKADYDSISVTVQGFTIGVRVKQRTPYSRIDVSDDGAPFSFDLSVHFDSTSDPSRTDFWIELSADLNFMMKMMLGSKIQEALDKLVDSLVDISEGRMPEGIDPSMFPGSKSN